MRIEQRLQRLETAALPSPPVRCLVAPIGLDDAAYAAWQAEQVANLATANVVFVRLCDGGLGNDLTP